MKVNLIENIKVLLFNENGRLLYQFDGASTVSTTNSFQQQQQHQTQQQLESGETLQQNMSSISECVFGSVSIQSPPDVCITRIHQLSNQSLMTSLVFDIKTLQPNTSTTITITTNTTDTALSTTNVIPATARTTSNNNKRSRSQKDSCHSRANSNQNNNISSQNQYQNSVKHRTSCSTTNSNDLRNILTNCSNRPSIRKKLGLALIWSKYPLSSSSTNSIDNDHNLQHSSHDMTDFVLNHIKAIDMYLDQLKNNIVNSTPALKSKIIHEHICSCLNSINLYANASIVSNITSLNRNDYIEEFMCILDELDNRGLHSVLVGILSVFYNFGDCRKLQIVLTSSSIEKKSLILRILFIIYCFYFDSNLNDFFWRNNRLKQIQFRSPVPNTCPQRNLLSNFSHPQPPYHQEKVLEAEGFTVLTLEPSESDTHPPSRLINSNHGQLKNHYTPVKVSSPQKHSKDNFNTTTINNNEGENMLLDTCDMYEFIQAPRDFSMIPLYKMRVIANNLCLICEPIVTNSYLLPASLQCIISGEVDLLHQQLLKGSQKFTILRVNCDSW